MPKRAEWTANLILPRENMKERKGWALAGSKKDWPVGLVTLKPEWDAVENILVVEGGPDYFALFPWRSMHRSISGSVAILGAAMSSPSDATRPYLSKKKILIIPHNDPAGTKRQG